MNMNSTIEKPRQRMTPLQVAIPGDPTMSSLLGQGCAHEYLPDHAGEAARHDEPVCIVRNKSVNDAFDPSRQEYGSLLEAYDYFNETLFSKRLPPALITLNHGRASVRGYY